MKKNFMVGFVIFMAIGLVACMEQGNIKAGSATGKAMLRLIPATARVVLMVDIHRSMTADTVQNVLKDEKTKQKYDEFVKMAGLDPMKDIYFVAVGLTGDPAGRSQEGVIFINLRYSKDTLLAKIKENAKDIREETYSGVTLYGGPAVMNMGHAAPAGAFLDDSNIVVGNDKSVRAAVDVFQKKADSVDKNPEMKKLFKAVNMSANVWGAAIIPQEILKSQADKNPMLKDLVGLTGLTMSFDYANRTLTAEIQGLGGAAEQNKALAEKLTALKGMGTMMAGKEPVLGELVNKIEISSSADSVKIYASIPGELLEKAQKLARERFGNMIQFNPPVQKEEKKEGTKVKK
ncbi:MAG: hypothetical protein ABSG19_09395 [Candidatus Aminicenantales bacterium]